MKNRTEMAEQRVTVWDICNDLDADKVLRAVRKQSTRDLGEFLFDPDSWKGRNEELKIDICRLSNDQLKAYGVLATQIRSNFRAMSHAALEADKIEDIEEQKEMLNQVPVLNRNH